MSSIIDSDEAILAGLLYYTVDLAVCSCEVLVSSIGPAWGVDFCGYGFASDLCDLVSERSGGVGKKIETNPIAIIYTGRRVLAFILVMSHRWLHAFRLTIRIAGVVHHVDSVLDQFLVLCRDIKDSGIISRRSKSSCHCTRS